MGRGVHAGGRVRDRHRGPAATEEEQDLADAESLFALLEQQVVPTYYERDENGLPPRWIEMMRHSIAELGTQFSTTRMVMEYVERLYLPAHIDLIDQLATA